MAEVSEKDRETARVACGCGFCRVNSYTECQTRTRIAQALAHARLEGRRESEREAEAKSEYYQRRCLWMHHGHRGPMLYGDDGEMQCTLCRPHWDYRRAPLVELELQVAALVQSRLDIAVTADGKG